MRLKIPVNDDKKTEKQYKSKVPFIKGKAFGILREIWNHEVSGVFSNGLNFIHVKCLKNSVLSVGTIFQLGLML